MPTPVGNQIIAMHREFLAKKTALGGGGRVGMTMGGSSTQPMATAAPGRPLLNLRLDRYPMIADILQDLERDSVGRNYTDYTNCIVTEIGAQTAAELLSIIYEDVDTKAKSASPISGTEALMKYITDALGEAPQKVLVSNMLREFERTSIGYEANN
jgi:hypothetical protein